MQKAHVRVIRRDAARGAKRALGGGRFTEVSPLFSHRAHGSPLLTIFRYDRRDVSAGGTRVYERALQADVER